MYPEAREHDGAEEIVGHSQKEHLEADQLLRELAGHEMGDAAWSKAVDDLIESIEHHIQEEEETVLPFLKERLSTERLQQLGEDFLALRQEHLGERAEDITKDQLAQQADNLDMAVGDRSKGELQAALDAQAES